MVIEADQHRFMARAIRLGERGLYTTDPNPRVGCVIVQGDQIVGEGWHQRAGEDHAEIAALKAAGERARGATLYVTLEPCSHHGKTPPCADALIEAGVAKVIVAMRDPNPRVCGAGLEKLHAAGIVVESGIQEEQARALNPGFIKRMEQGLPCVRLKMAASLDGRTAMASGESQWITGPDARRDVQRLRARSSVVLTGIGTVAADDPALTVRAQQLGDDLIARNMRQPLRVVLDSNFKTLAAAKMFGLEGETLVIGTADNSARQALHQAGVATLLVPPAGDGGVSLKEVLRKLAEREANEVLVEAGATLAGAFLQANLVDELVLYLAPCLIGGEGRALVQLPGLAHLKDRLQLRISEVRSIGVDLRISAIVSPL